MISNLMNIEKSVIVEASEAEENNLTQHKIGGFGLQRRKSNDMPYADYSKGGESNRKAGLDSSARDKNRDSMFGTMLLTNGLSKEHEARVLQMQDPHLVMQQRLNDMNPMMFGDTMRLPVFRDAQTDLQKK